MKTKILCCRTLEPEVRLAMKKCGCSFELDVLQENNHDVPHLLRQNIQRKLDAMEDAERVLLAFTTCGGAMVGLKAGNFELVIPRVDDCLSLLMGSMERRKAVLEGGFGLFVTKNWLDHERSIEAELDRILQKYTPRRAQSVIDAMYGEFDSLNVIDTGSYSVEELLPRTQELARRLKLKHRIVRGTTEYLEDLLRGPYEPSRFIRIAPDCTVSDADVLMHGFRTG